MAYTYDDYSNRFHEKAGTDGLSYTFKQTFSVIPAALGYTIDTLLGLDNLLGNDNEDDRYNYFRGPFGILLGGIPLVIGLGLGYVLEYLIRAPGAIGMLIDLGVSKLWDLTHPYEHATRFPFNKWMVTHQIGVAITGFLFNLLTDKAIKPEMHGPVGFVFGYIPALAYYAINRIAAIPSSLVKYIVDHACDAVRFVYSSIGKGFKYIFGNKKVTPITESPAQFEEEKPSTKRKPRLVRTKEVEEETLKNDTDLQNVLASSGNIFEALNISSEEFIHAQSYAKTKLVKDAFRKASLTCHPDKQSDKTEAEQQTAAVKWKQINDARDILADPTKYNIYMGGYEKNPSRFFYKPISPVNKPTATPYIAPVADDQKPNGHPTPAPTTEKQIKRTRLKRG
jgi:hypothetical protein